MTRESGCRTRRQRFWRAGAVRIRREEPARPENDALTVRRPDRHIAPVEVQPCRGSSLHIVDPDVCARVEPLLTLTAILRPSGESRGFKNGPVGAVATGCAVPARSTHTSERSENGTDAADGIDQRPGAETAYCAAPVSSTRLGAFTACITPSISAMGAPDTRSDRRRRASPSACQTSCTGDARTLNSGHLRLLKR